MLQKADQNVPFEQAPLEKLSNDKELAIFKHYGKWKCMDTLRDKIEFEEISKTDPFWVK